MNLKNEAFLLQEQIVSWRRDLHKIPEIRMQTPKTMAYIAAELKKAGIQDIRENIAGNGLVCVIRGNRPGKCLAIRADIDALPLEEETQLEFKSVHKGYMHACGHDAHAAMTMAAAKLIHEHREELKGTVKIIFQPGEETAEGAKKMIEANILEEPHVDAIIGMHTGNLMGREYKSGDLIYPGEVSTAGSRSFSVTIYGKKAHAAEPNKGIDPILAACHICTTIPSLLSRETEPGRTGIASIQVIRGGTRSNMIPDECYMEGSIRSLSMEEQDYYFRRVKEISENVARSMRCTAKVEQKSNLKPTINDVSMIEILKRIAPQIVDTEKIKKQKKVSPGGEDFSEYALKIPAVYFFLSSAFGDERDFPHHNSKFDLDESPLWSGSGIFAAYALGWQD